MLVRIVKVMIPIVKMTIESPESNRKLTPQGHRTVPSSAGGVAPIPLHIPIIYTDTQ